MGISGDEIYNCILEGDIDSKMSTLNELKRHVKKDNVNLSFVPRYFESLSIVMDTNSPSLQSLAFSLICHLVKRVSIQDNDGTLLLDQSFLVLPIIIPRLADAKQSIKIAAGRTLEAYWLSAATKVDAGLIEYGLSNRNPLIVNESVVWINHILTSINPYLKLDRFFDALASILVKHKSEKALVVNVKTLFANYYDLKHNNLRIFELQRVLESHNVDTSLRRTIMGTDSIIRGDNLKPSMPKVGSSNIDGDIMKLATHQQIESRAYNKQTNPRSPQVETKDFLPTPKQRISAENCMLDDHLNSLPNYQFDSAIAVIDVYEPNQLYGITSEMSPCFEGKESEKNWLSREKCILKLRSLIRGNSVKEYLPDMLLHFKGLIDPLCKGLLSLRTTLSVNSCLLVKEMAQVLREDFDSLSEILFPTLIKLCAATKHLTTTNAHLSVCAILANCSFNTRLGQKIIAAASDKSVNTKSYSSFWLQILLHKYYDTELLNAILDVLEKVLSKTLSDPSSQVRQSAKDCFRKYYDTCPSQCSKLFKSLDPATVKALGRAMPELLGKTKATSILTIRSGPSLRESIISKNKELRAKQSVSRSSSRNFARSGSDHISDGPFDDQERGVSSSSKQIKPATQYQLSVPSVPHTIPHYAQSTFSQRLSSLPNVKAFKAQNEQVKDHKYKLKYHSSEDNFKPLKRHEFENVAAFDNKTDPLINFLSSSQDEFVREGINLLRYAIIGGEDLSKEVFSSVRRISLANPLLLRLLFEEGENLLAKTRNIFSLEDYLRLCSIILPLTEKHINTIITVFDVDELYATVTILLSYIADLDNIVDDKLLVMQIIKFKTKILETLLKFLVHASSLIPLSDVNFTKLAANLFDLVPIVHLTPSYEIYKDLLKNLYEINSVLFTSQLSVASKVSRSEIEQFVGINSLLHFNVSEKPLFNPVSELTEIAFGKSSFKMSPLKQPSDFTMLMPVKSSEPDGPILIQDSIVDVKKEFSFENSLKANQNLPFKNSNILEFDDGDVIMRDSESGMEVKKDANFLDKADLQASPVEVPEPLHFDGTSGKDKMDSVQKDDVDSNVSFFQKSLSSASSTELVDDFAQVKLTNADTSIQNLIERVDPLSKISSKNKPIFIFEDSKTGSPEKAREYSYLDLNWFNFLIAKLSLNDCFEQSVNRGMDEFKILCEKLKESSLSASQFSCLLSYIQNNQDHEFEQFLEKEGLLLFELSLWTSCVSDDNATSMNNLLLVKQMLISKRCVDLEKLWGSLLASITKCEKHFHETNVILGEVFDEALRGCFPTIDLTQVVLSTLKDVSNVPDKALSFSVECLYKLMSARTLALKVNGDLVSKINHVLYPLIDHPNTEIRKLSFQTYGRLMRAINISGISNRVLSPEKSDHCLEDEILVNLSGPQKRLVEYFSQLSA